MEENENKTCTEILNDLAMREDVVAMDPETQRMLWEARDAHANEMKVLECELKCVRNEVVNQRNRCSRLEREIGKYKNAVKEYGERHRNILAVRDEVSELWSPVTSTWPRYEDLTPVLVGDSVEDGGRRMTVHHVVASSCGASVTLRDDDDTKWYRYCFDGKTFRRWVWREQPTEPEDSWERLQEDLHKAACEYYGMSGSATCVGCRAEGEDWCADAKLDDIIDRAKRLAGVDDGR